MKRFLQFSLLSLSFLLPVVAAVAVSTNQNLLVFPFGTWQACENGEQTLICTGFKPGQEQYVLIIKGQSAQANRYTYTVMATMADGRQVLTTGKAVRDDNAAGYTYVYLAFGGVAVAFQVDVEESMVTGGQTGVMRL